MNFQYQTIEEATRSTGLSMAYSGPDSPAKDPLILALVFAGWDWELAPVAFTGCKLLGGKLRARKGEVVVTHASHGCYTITKNGKHALRPKRRYSNRQEWYAWKADAGESSIEHLAETAGMNIPEFIEHLATTAV